MNCSEISPLLSVYIDNELQNDEYESVQRHLATCNSCTAIAEDLERVSMSIKQSFSQIYAPTWLESVFEYRIEGIRETEQASHLRIAAEFGMIMMTIFAFSILMSPVGKAIWSIANIASRLSHGGYVLLRHVMVGNGWIVGSILLCAIVTIMSLYMMKKVMQHTVVHTH